MHACLCVFWCGGQVDSRPTVVPPVGSGVGIGVVDSAPPPMAVTTPELELRFQFDQLYVIDLQPADPSVVAIAAGNALKFSDANGQVNGPMLLECKPNCVVMKPRTRTLDVDDGGSLDTSLSRAIARRRVFLQRTAAMAVVSAAKAADAARADASNVRFNSHRGVRRPGGSDSISDGLFHVRRMSADDPAVFPGTAPLVEQDERDGSDSDVDGVEDEDDDYTGEDGQFSAVSTIRSAGSDPAGGIKRRLVRLVDGPEFQHSSSTVPMLIVTVSIPTKSEEAKATLADWKARNVEYVHKQKEAWANGLPIPFPTRDTLAPDTKTGFRINIQANAMSFVHTKRFEDEIKAAIDITIVSVCERFCAAWYRRCIRIVRLTHSRCNRIVSVLSVCAPCRRHSTTTARCGMRLPS